MIPGLNLLLLAAGRKAAGKAITKGVVPITKKVVETLTESTPQLSDVSLTARDITPQHEIAKTIQVLQTIDHQQPVGLKNILKMFKDQALQGRVSKEELDYTGIIPSLEETLRIIDTYNYPDRKITSNAKYAELAEQAATMTVGDIIPMLANRMDEPLLIGKILSGEPLLTGGMKELGTPVPKYQSPFFHSITKNPIASTLDKIRDRFFNSAVFTSDVTTHTPEFVGPESGVKIIDNPKNLDISRYKIQQEISEPLYGSKKLTSVEDSLLNLQEMGVKVDDIRLLEYDMDRLNSLSSDSQDKVIRNAWQEYHRDLYDHFRTIGQKFRLFVDVPIRAAGSSKMFPQENRIQSWFKDIGLKIDNYSDFKEQFEKNFTQWLFSEDFDSERIVNKVHQGTNTRGVTELSRGTLPKVIIFDDIIKQWELFRGIKKENWTKLPQQVQDILENDFFKVLDDFKKTGTYKEGQHHITKASNNDMLMEHGPLVKYNLDKIFYGRLSDSNPTIIPPFNKLKEGFMPHTASMQLLDLNDYGAVPVYRDFLSTITKKEATTQWISPRNGFVVNGSHSMPIEDFIKLQALNKKLVINRLDRLTKYNHTNLVWNENILPPSMRGKLEVDWDKITPTERINRLLELDSEDTGVSVAAGKLISSIEDSVSLNTVPYWRKGVLSKFFKEEKFGDEGEYIIGIQEPRGDTYVHDRMVRINDYIHRLVRFGVPDAWSGRVKEGKKPTIEIIKLAKAIFNFDMTHGYTDYDYVPDTVSVKKAKNLLIKILNEVGFPKTYDLLNDKQSITTEIDLGSYSIRDLFQHQRYPSWRRAITSTDPTTSNHVQTARIYGANIEGKIFEPWIKASQSTSFLDFRTDQPFLTQINEGGIALQNHLLYKYKTSLLNKGPLGILDLTAEKTAVSIENYRQLDNWIKQWSIKGGKNHDVSILSLDFDKEILANIRNQGHLPTLRDTDLTNILAWSTSSEVPVDSVVKINADGTREVVPLKNILSTGDDGKIWGLRGEEFQADIYQRLRNVEDWEEMFSEDAAETFRIPFQRSWLEKTLINHVKAGIEKGKQIILLPNVIDKLHQYGGVMENNKGMIVVDTNVDAFHNLFPEEFLKDVGFLSDDPNRRYMIFNIGTRIHGPDRKTWPVEGDLGIFDPRWKRGTILNYDDEGWIHKDHLPTNTYRGQSGLFGNFRAFPETLLSPESGSPPKDLYTLEEIKLLASRNKKESASEFEARILGTIIDYGPPEPSQNSLKTPAIVKRLMNKIEDIRKGVTNMTELEIDLVYNTEWAGEQLRYGIRSWLLDAELPNQSIHETRRGVVNDQFAKKIIPYTSKRRETREQTKQLDELLKALRRSDIDNIPEFYDDDAPYSPPTNLEDALEKKIMDVAGLPSTWSLSLRSSGNVGLSHISDLIENQSKTNRNIWVTYGEELPKLLKKLARKLFPKSKKLDSMVYNLSKREDVEIPEFVHSHEDFTEETGAESLYRPSKNLGLPPLTDVIAKKFEQIKHRLFATGGLVRTLRIRKQRGGVAKDQDTFSVEEVQAILDSPENRDKTFVDRIRNPQNYPPLPLDEEGLPMSHKMTTFQDDQGGLIMPSLIYHPDTETYEQIDPMSSKEERQRLMDYGRETGEYIQFDNESDAAKFEKSWKQYPAFADYNHPTQRLQKGLGSVVKNEQHNL